MVKSTAEPGKSPVNRMAKRRQRTRRQLLDAVEAIVLNSGYEDATADSVSELADLGRSTFYNHFATKQEAVLAMLTEHYLGYGDAAFIPIKEIPDRALAVTVASLVIFQKMASDPLTAQLIDRPRLLSKAILDSQREYLAHDIAEGISQRRFNVVGTMDTLVSVLNWSFVGLLISSIQQDQVEQTSQEWSRFFLVNLGIAHDEIETLITQATELSNTKK